MIAPDTIPLWFAIPVGIVLTVILQLLPIPTRDSDDDGSDR